MQNHYFTFGTAHYTKAGVLMAHNWVRVVANHPITARKIFIEQFTKRQMKRPDVWSFQYTEEDFKPQYFHGGEYAVLYELQPGQPDKSVILYNLELHTTDKSTGAILHDYRQIGREDLDAQIAQAVRCSCVSNCVYYLNGSIDISLDCGHDLHMHGHFTKEVRSISIHHPYLKQHASV